MNKYEILYLNNNQIGIYENEKTRILNPEQKQEFFTDLATLFSKKESNRRLFSLLIGILMLIIAITFAILNIFDVFSIDWFTYTFICAGLIVLWVLSYFICGFIFYSKIEINFYFKDKSNRNYLHYASSNYSKYINKFSQYLGLTKFSYVDNNKKIVPFALKMPKFYQNIIYNGHIKSNVPYFYMSSEGNHILFVPGFVIFIDKKATKIISNSEITLKEDNKKYQLYQADTLLFEFINNGEFDLNFFYFNY